MKTDLSPPPHGYATADDDVAIAYYRTGTGPPLLLINGGPGFPAQHFGPLAEMLSDRLNVEVIRFDQRGTGRSTFPNPTKYRFTLDVLVDDMEALRVHLGLSSWIVMGHSFGAILAMALASSHPLTVEHLVLSAPAGIDMGFKNRLDVGIQARLASEEKAALAALADAPDTYQRQLDILSIILSAYICDKKSLPALIAAAVDSHVYQPNIASLVWEALEANDGYNIRPMLKGLAVPTIILQGEYDPIGRETIDEICGVIPSASRISITEASHYPWIDNSGDYFSAIRSAIGRG